MPIDQTSTSSNESDSSFEDRCQIPEIPNSMSRQSKKFSVVIARQSYEKIKLKEKKIITRKGSRIELRLQKGWIDIFLDSLWHQHKIPCSYAILYHKVNNSNIMFKGKCTECNSLIFGDIDEIHGNNEDITLDILAVDTRDLKHSKKRFLLNPKRLEVGADILYSNASQWRRNMADKSMHYGDIEPPNIQGLSFAKNKATSSRF